MKSLLSMRKIIPKKLVEEEKPALKDYFKYYFLHAPEDDYIGILVIRAIFFAIFIFWGMSFILHPVDSDYLMQSFIHLPNLVFHEAGHFIFSPFGKFIRVLGGSLMQVLMPFIVMCTFVLKNRDGYAASIGLWWVGQNFMDMAPYIGDARDLKLPLLGGVTGREVADYHDWEYLLEATGLINQDLLLAKLSHYFGSMLMITAFIWGGYMLYLEYVRIKGLENQ